MEHTQLEPETPNPIQHDDDSPASLSGMLHSQLTRLGRFLRRRWGPMLRAKESVSDLKQSVCRELIERWMRSPPPCREEGQRWFFQIAQRKLIDRLRYYGREKRNPLREV